MFTRSLTALACVTLLTATTTAAPLTPTNVAKDAKWVIHVDCEALTDAKFVERTSEEWPQKQKMIRQYMEQRYGITPDDDLKSLTMFSDTYEKHTGVAILNADYSRKKVISLLESKSDSQESEWQGHTVYKWTAKRGHGNEEKSADAGKLNDNQIVTILVDANTVVFAGSETRAKWAVGILKGSEPSLEEKSDTRLISESALDAYVYAAAIDLGQVPESVGIFGVLQQHERILFSLKQDEDELVEQWTFSADDEETAENMKEAVEGFVALAKVSVADSETLTRMFDETEVDRDGKTVKVEWRDDTGEVVSALEAFAKQVDYWRMAKGHGKSQRK